MKKVVFTNGVFDLLHSGHLHLLKESKKLGDYLIVGIDSDERVKKIKPGRPINNQEDRKLLLQSLKDVDEVIIFDDLLSLILSVRPDVLVKGGDYTENTIVGSDIVKSWGGTVAIINRIEDKSTTNIIKKVQELVGNIHE